jgi:ribosomal protein L29
MSKKTEEFLKKNEKELYKLLAEKREALRDFRFSMKGSRVRNTKEGSKLRKDIARILQILGKKTETAEAEKENKTDK